MTCHECSLYSMYFGIDVYYPNRWRTFSSFVLILYSGSKFVISRSDEIQVRIFRYLGKKGKGCEMIQIMWLMKSLTLSQRSQLSFQLTISNHVCEVILKATPKWELSILKHLSNGWASSESYVFMSDSLYIWKYTRKVIRPTLSVSHVKFYENRNVSCSINNSLWSILKRYINWIKPCVLKNKHMSDNWRNEVDFNVLKNIKTSYHVHSRNSLSYLRQCLH